MSLLFELDSDALREIFKHMNTPYMLKRTCRALRDVAPKKTITQISDMVCSLSLFEEAMACGAMAVPAYWAARGGFLHYLPGYLDQANERWDCDLSEFESDDEDDGTVCWGRRDRVDCFRAEVFNGAARGGRLQILEWVNALEPTLVPLLHSATAAVSGGQVEALNWLVMKGCKVGPKHAARMLEDATESGHFEMVRYLELLCLI